MLFLKTHECKILETRLSEVSHNSIFLFEIGNICQIYVRAKRVLWKSVILFGIFVFRNTFECKGAKTIRGFALEID